MYALVHTLVIVLFHNVELNPSPENFFLGAWIHALQPSSLKSQEQDKSDLNYSVKAEHSVRVEGSALSDIQS